MHFFCGKVHFLGIEDAFGGYKSIFSGKDSTFLVTDSTFLGKEVTFLGINLFSHGELMRSSLGLLSVVGIRQGIREVEESASLTKRTFANTHIGRTPKRYNGHNYYKKAPTFE